MKSKATKKRATVSNEEDKFSKLLEDIDNELSWFFTEYSTMPETKKQAEKFGMELALVLYNIKTKTIPSWKRQSSRFPKKEKKALLDFLAGLGNLFAAADAASGAKIRVSTMVAILEDIERFYKKNRVKPKRLR